ncbi:MAG: NUDIX domain-containing protein [Jatrophihabitans sp.]|uniref:NUDIX domain-containing protein n=1 Tax=Jatrophihabitans sp. TaxID=1932789 RepID=UPI003F7F1065
MADTIRQVSSREVYRSRWMRVREDEVEFPDGSPGLFAVVEKPDFVVVIPFVDGGFWLVEQYRYTIGSRQWEFPQGAWPQGHSGTIEELAAAELAEETGFSAGSFEHLGQLFSCYGFCGQHYDVFLATELTPGEPKREVTEQDMVHRWFPESEVRAMIARGELKDAHTVACLFLLDQHRSS